MWSPPSDLPAPTDLLRDTETKKAKLPPGSPVARAEAALAEEKVNSKAGPGCDRKRKAQCRPARRGAGKQWGKGARVPEGDRAGLRAHVFLFLRVRPLESPLTSRSLSFLLCELLFFWFLWCLRCTRVWCFQSMFSWLLFVAHNCFCHLELVHAPPTPPFLFLPSSPSILPRSISAPLPL